MASSAKKRREAKEEALVASTVAAVMEALKTKGVFKDSGTHDNHSVEANQHSERSTTENTRSAAVDNANINVHTTQCTEINEISCGTNSNSGSSITTQVQELLSGAQLPATTGTPTLTGASVALHSLVPAKLKQAVWAKEFVEFSSLLNKGESTDYAVQINAAGELSVSHKQDRKNLSIGQWLSAFTLFMDVYIQKYPWEASGLLAYLNMVRDLERVYGVAAFNFYDRQFRLQRQSHELPWGTLHNELWIKATTLAAKTDTTSTRAKSDRYCYKYNKPAGCSDRSCRFQHICKICYKKHPEFRCFSRQPKPVGQPAASATASDSRPGASQGNSSFRAIHKK